MWPNEQVINERIATAILHAVSECQDDVAGDLKCGCDDPDASGLFLSEELREGSCCTSPFGRVARLGVELST